MRPNGEIVDLAEFRRSRQREAFARAIDPITDESDRVYGEVYAAMRDRHMSDEYAHSVATDLAEAAVNEDEQPLWAEYVDVGDLYADVFGRRGGVQWRRNVRVVEALERDLVQVGFPERYAELTAVAVVADMEHNPDADEPWWGSVISAAAEGLTENGSAVRAELEAGLDELERGEAALDRDDVAAAERHAHRALAVWHAVEPPRDLRDWHRYLGRSARALLARIDRRRGREHKC